MMRHPRITVDFGTQGETMATALIKRITTPEGGQVIHFGDDLGVKWREHCEKNGGSHDPSQGFDLRPSVTNPHPNRGKPAHRPNQDFLFK